MSTPEIFLFTLPLILTALENKTEKNKPQVFTNSTENNKERGEGRRKNISEVRHHIKSLAWAGEMAQ